VCDLPKLAAGPPLPRPPLHPSSRARKSVTCNQRITGVLQRAATMSWKDGQEEDTQTPLWWDLLWLTAVILLVTLVALLKR